MKKYINYYSLPDTANDNSNSATTIKWIHLTDASMRIEAIISGQAIMTNQHIPPMSNITQTVAVQPPSTPGITTLDDYHITPLPHTIVVIKHSTSASYRSTQERRSRRAGRLSRKFISNYIAHLPDDNDDECCATCPSFLCCTFHYTSPTRSTLNQPIMC